MGLDMHLYKVSRLSDDEMEELNKKKDLKEAEVEEFGYVCFHVKDGESDYDIAELKPYLRKITVISNGYINLEYLKRDNGIPQNAYVSSEGYSQDKVELTFTTNSGKFYKKLSLTDVELEKYTTYPVEEQYVVKMDEVMYWRKAYPLQRAIHDIFAETHSRGLDNCEYCLATEDMLDIMQYPEQLLHSYDDEDSKMRIGWAVNEARSVGKLDELKDNEAYFYWEWY